MRTAGPGTRTRRRGASPGAGGQRSAGRQGKKSQERDFPGGPVAKTWPSSAGGAGLTPGRGAKIPHASWPEHKTEGYNNKFNKDFFFNDPHF